MTATLPQSRRAQLVAAGLSVFPSEADREMLSDLREKESAPRYRLKRVADAVEARTIAIDAFKAGMRVLWVVNRVNVAQELADELAQATGTQVLCYHSRFRLMDRQRCHASTVAAFQAGDQPVIAVTTQVCEMSLDLDAHVLITEECPMTGLVQRFGRANRHLRRPGMLGQLFTYKAESERPYSRKELEGVESFLGGLDGREISQEELAVSIEQLSLRETDVDGTAPLFSSGYYASPREFRDLDEFATRAVLDADVNEVLRLMKAREPIDGFIVPVPKKYAQRADEALPPWLMVASAAHYDEALGFRIPEKEA